MEKRELVKGDIVQISPKIEHRWGGFLCVVDEPKSFGCQGYLLHWRDFEAVRIKATGKAYVRLKFEDIEYVGRMEWVHHDKDNLEEEGE